MKILGIDPGLRITGYGLIEANSPYDIRLIEAGVIRTPSKTCISERLAKIYTGLESLVNEAKPEYLAIEKIYAHYKHPTTAILMAHARSMACLLAGTKGMKLVNYPSTRIKKAITGNGYASKVQIQQAIMTALKLKKAPEPVDVTDAIALAIGFVNIELKSRLLNK